MKDIPLPKNIWLRLLLAPVIGGAFVLFLPLAGIVLFLVEGWRWAVGTKKAPAEAGAPSLGIRDSRN